MKQKSKLKRLIGSFALGAALVAVAVGGAITLNPKVEASAEDAPVETPALEVTHLAGMRSNSPRIYWRIDETEYASGFDLATDVECKYTNSSGEVTAKVLIEYYKASANKGPGITSDRPSGDYPCLYFKADQTAATGDTLTIPSGTVLKGADGVDKYYLDQDYTFVYNGGWSFDESSQKIPVGLTGVSNGGRATTYFQAYCDTFLGDYYDSGTVLSSTAKADMISGESTSEVTLTFKYLTSSNNINTAAPTLQIQGLSTAASVGDKVVLKKGTTVFDNFTFDRDYTFTYIGTNYDSNCWSMSASTDENDPETTLSLRGNGGAGFIQFFMPNEHSCTPDGGQQYFNMNPELIINGTTKYGQRMHGLTKSGDNYSFGIELGSNNTATAGDIIKLLKGTYILGYKLADDYMFKWDGSAWSRITCDGTNHIYDDENKCHDRECACGYVDKATEPHTFEENTYVCQDRTCTTCGDDVAASAHTFAAGSYECQDRTCTVCSAQIAGDPEKHVKTGEGCEVSCANCKESFAAHEFPEAPETGWTVSDDAVTVTTEPTCTVAGVGTVKCNNCTETTEVAVNALGHSLIDGEKYCERGCGYRIPYTQEDMDEILALDSLTKYTYSDASPVDEKSTLGQISRAESGGYDNNFTINCYEDEEGNNFYEEGKENTHDMLVSFSLNLTDWAGEARSHFVYLNSHENGAWGIGFQFVLREGARNLRVNYKPIDNKYGGDGRCFIEAVSFDLAKFALNTEQQFTLGAVQNDDGSWFVFAYWNGELFLSGTLTNEILEECAEESTHNGLGGGVGFVFNGSQAGGLSVTGRICDIEHKAEGETFACKNYDCTVCGVTVIAKEEHSWGESVKTGEGSCTVKEQYTRTCEVCGDKTEYEGKFVHTWDKENPIVVTEAACGGVDRVVKYDCTLCDEVSEEEPVPGSGYEGVHKYEYKEIVAATCVSEGQEQGVCTRCGATEEPSKTPINKNAHAYGDEIAAVPATCTANGTKAHYECSLCDKIFVKNGDVYTEVTAADLVIAAGHSYGDEIAAVPATCTADGTKAHYECSACQKIFVKNGDVYTEVTAADLVIAAGHSYGDEIAEVSATCTANGTKAHYECSLCGKLFVMDGGVYTEVTAADLVIATIAHDYQYVEAVAATKDADGVKEHYRCSECGKLFEKNAEGEYVETTAEALKVVYEAPAKKKGCGSSLSMAGLIATLTLFGGAVAVARKRKD